MGKFCDNCENLIEDDFQFCPYCSNPLTPKAKDLDDKKTINSQLVLLVSLLKEIDNENALKVINKYITALSKK